jgi:hypothetical protein
VARNLFWLSDEQWKRIEPHLPTDVRGVDRADDRRECTLDAPAQLVETLAEPERLLPIAFVGDDGLGSALVQLLSQFDAVGSLRFHFVSTLADSFLDLRGSVESSSYGALSQSCIDLRGTACGMRGPIVCVSTLSIVCTIKALAL